MLLGVTAKYSNLMFPFSLWWLETHGPSVKISHLTCTNLKRLAWPAEVAALQLESGFLQVAQCGKPSSFHVS